MADSNCTRTARMLDRKGVKLAIKMLKQIRKLGYAECALREFERRMEREFESGMEGQSGGDQRDIVGEYLEKAKRDPDPHVLAGMTAILTDFLNTVLQGTVPDIEIYDDIDAYLNEDGDDEGEGVPLDPRLQDVDMSRPQ